jgi:hypothetical protein
MTSSLCPLWFKDFAFPISAMTRDVGDYGDFFSPLLVPWMPCRFAARL